jgi:hypothetical protein
LCVAAQEIQGIDHARVSDGIQRLCGFWLEEYHSRLQLIVCACRGGFCDIVVSGIYSWTYSSTYVSLGAFEIRILGKLVKCGGQELLVGLSAKYLW